MLTLPIIFSQFDQRWCGHLLGYNTDPQYNIYNYGCLLCCLAMVLKYYGLDTDPLRLNQALCENNGFAANTGLYEYGSLTRIYPGISDVATKTPNKLTDEQVNEIKSLLDANIPVVLQIDYNPKIVAPTMHFVVAIAYNPNDENDFTIADPLGGKTHSLKDYLGWYHPSARDTIEAYVAVKGPVPTLQSNDTVPVNAKVFPEIVHGSTQWDKTIDKYLNGSDPKLTNFEDLDKVIGGIKSRTTDVQNKLSSQAGDMAAAVQSVENLKEQLANEELQRQQDKAMYSAQLNALKMSGLNVDKISQTYEGRITALQQQVKSLLQDKHDLATQGARLQATATAISFAEKYLPTFLRWYDALNRK